jgi:hypothetical protein
MKITWINYWDKELYIHTRNHNGQDMDISITESKVEFEVDGEYYGPDCYYHTILLYDLCALIELWKEVYGDDT